MPPYDKSLASPSAAFGSLTEFELGYHDQALGTLFGNHDGFERPSQTPRAWRRR
jgi:hypothetical protein